MLEALVELEPAGVHLFGRGKSFQLPGAVGLDDRDFKSRPVRRRSNFALNGLRAPLEEVEHTELSHDLRRSQDGQSFEPDVDHDLVMQFEEPS